MRVMLDAHPDVRCGEETRVIPRILEMHRSMIQSDTEMQRLREAKVEWYSVHWYTGHRVWVYNNLNVAYVLYGFGFVKRSVFTKMNNYNVL